MQIARRLDAIPPYLFAEIDKLKAKTRATGMDIIDLGIGDPDRPTPPHVIEALCEAAAKPGNHRYPPYDGTAAFKQAVADWYRLRHQVELDAENQVLALIGSKEGIVHVFLAFVDPGEPVLFTEPGYPPYRVGTLLAGGVPHPLPLQPENDFLPRLDLVDPDLARQAKILFINYPNNPTGAVATPEFFQKVVEFAREYQVLVCHDAAYLETTFDGYRAPSFLATPGALEVGMEFHSLSKPFNMTGWRVGFAVGNAQAVGALGIVKTNLDSGVFNAVQEAAIAAMTGSQAVLDEQNAVYQERRDVVVDGLNRLGWRLEKPRGTFYIWAPVPRGYDSKGFAATLLEREGVNVTPGIGYGSSGEGFFRIALTVEAERMQEAMKRIARQFPHPGF